MDETNTDRRTLLAAAVVAAGATMPLAPAAAQNAPSDVTNEHHRQLEERIHALDRSIADLGADRHGDQLVLIIHHPAGWTTIAEGTLVLQAIDALQQQVTSVRAQYSKLLDAARLVSAEPQPSPW